MNYPINFNGSLTDPEVPVATAFNRSLRYGDGLFETMLWDGLKIQNEIFHMDRLFQGLRYLDFDLSAGFTREFITAEINILSENNAAGSNARIRLNIYREDGSAPLPGKNKPVFIIESSLLPEQIQTPLRLTVFDGEKKSFGILSNLKTNNYLLNILAKQFANNHHYDDAVILNSNGNVCEASSSNLFMVNQGTFYTPALTEACVAGTKRRELIRILPVLGFPVEEIRVTREMLFDMEEVFLTNAIRGIRPVENIDKKFYSQTLTNTLIQLVKDVSG